MRKALAEVWQENETSITLKMLSESMKSNDHERVEALKRSLLDLEAKYEKTAIEPEDDSASPDSHQCKSLNSPSHIQFNEASQTFSPQEVKYLQKAIEQNTKSYDLQISMMFIGDSFTGKTSLMNAIIGSENPLKTKPTTG